LFPFSAAERICFAASSEALALPPPGEHFLSKPGETWEKRWGAPSRFAYLEHVLRQNTAADGVFGAVVMWSYFDRMLRMLHEIRDTKILMERSFSPLFSTGLIHLDAAPEPCRAGGLLGHGMPDRYLESESRGKIATARHIEVRFQSNRRMVQADCGARSGVGELFSSKSN